MMLGTKKHIEIFIGGSTNKYISDSYNHLALQLGKIINDRDYLIWFDGCDGLPKIVYDQLKDKSRASIVYSNYYGIPKIDFRFVLEKHDQSDVTKALVNVADAIIFFKGGLGTLTEITKALDEKKNHEHDKPIVILNINHEWDTLIDLLTSYDLNDLYCVTDNVEDCLDYIEKEIFNKNSTFYKHYIDEFHVAARDKPMFIKKI